MKNKKLWIVLGVVAVVSLGIIVVVGDRVKHNPKVDINVVETAPTVKPEHEQEEEEKPDEEIQDEPQVQEESDARTSEEEDDIRKDGIYGDTYNLGDGDSESENSSERTGGLSREDMDKLNNTSEEDLEASEEIFGLDQGGVPAE